MIKAMHHYHWLALLGLLSWTTGQVHASPQTPTETELLLLPKYCLGTQHYRGFSKDTVPIDEYMRMYGKAFYHTHHYCNALIMENDIPRIKETWLKKSTANYALGEIQYVLDRSETDFKLLPDIYSTRARLLQFLGRNGEAIGALMLAIQANKQYEPGYLQLSDLFKKLGKNDKAVEVLQEGLANVPGSKRIIRKIERLGAKPDPRYLTEPSPPTPVAEGNPSPEADKPTITPATSHPPESTATGEQLRTEDTGGASHNGTKPPYCRFCP